MAGTYTDGGIIQGPGSVRESTLGKFWSTGSWFGAGPLEVIDKAEGAQGANPERWRVALQRQSGSHGAQWHPLWLCWSLLSKAGSDLGFAPTTHRSAGTGGANLKNQALP